MAESSDPEILVHIAAPGRATDDTRYRAFAAAYLAFEPLSRRPIDAGSSSPLSGPGQAAQDEAFSSQSKTSALMLNGFIGSPAASFESVWASTDPRTAGHPARPVDMNELPSSQLEKVQLSRAPRPGIVEDSNPDNDMTMGAFCSPTRLLENYLQGFESQSQSQAVTVTSSQVSIRGTSSQPSFQSDVNVVPGTPDLQSQKSLGVASQMGSSPGTHTQVIPSSQPSASPPERPGSFRKLTSAQGAQSSSHNKQPKPRLGSNSHDHSPSMSNSGLLRGDLTNIEVIGDSFEQPKVLGPATGAHMATMPRKRPTPISDDTHVSSDIKPPLLKASLMLSRAQSAPPAPKRQKSIPSSTPPSSLDRADSDLGPGLAHLQGSVPQLQALKRGAVFNSFEIRAPGPSVSVANLVPADMITKQLDKLAKDLTLEKRFRPKERKRDLRPFERGYWLMDCQTWDSDLKKEAWNFLGNYIGGGLAGWGIRCARDEKLSWIRVYCWGCIVGQIYLLLYLSSKRKILLTGAEWVGGNGEAVIIMKRRGKS